MKRNLAIFTGKIMAKCEYEKSIKVPAKPPKKQGASVSFVEGAKATKSPKPKSLTPLKKK
jgi:hypothetical protein